MGGENVETADRNSSFTEFHCKGKEKNGVITGVRLWVKKVFFLCKMGEITAWFHANRNSLWGKLDVGEKWGKNFWSSILKAIKKEWTQVPPMQGPTCLRLCPQMQPCPCCWGCSDCAPSLSQPFALGITPHPLSPTQGHCPPQRESIVSFKNRNSQKSAMFQNSLFVFSLVSQKDWNISL